ncbi:MAG TPA: triple tyrosine motif-containing protein, partial [Rhodothermales bacterium]|nr:triple tyrosine motif-containing protein [Rhodothermales bacterium]
FVHVGDSSYVYVLAEDETGRLWVGGELLRRLDPQMGLMEESSWETLVHEAVKKNIQAIYPATGGVVWLGTEFKGLHRFEPATGHIKTYPVATETADGLRGKAVRFIHPDPDGHTLWLGTDFGLVRFDSEIETFRHYLQRDGLPGSSVFGMLQDDEGSLWISTNQGLAHFDPTTETFIVYTEADGTGNTEYNRRAAYRDGDGTFYFGGLNGVTSFHPSTIRTNPVVPPVVLTRIEAARRDTVRTLKTFGRNELRLSYLDYTFAFEYAALSYTNPSKNRYAYMLVGFDEDWVDAGIRRRAAYTNIPPGEYTFRVKGANEDGVWNEQGTALQVHIAAPWWTRWWFRLLTASLILAVFYGAYRYRVAHLLREERMRLRIAGDLHDEIGSKLSSIALASEMVTARATLGDREQRQLTEVTRQARRMVDDLRDIVWFVNPRHDHLDDLIVRMRHVAAEMLNGTRHTFHAPGEAWNRALDMERRRHLYLMFREVLTNITRHAQANQVDIRLAQRDGSLEVIIYDDGIGFDPAAPSQGEGLHNLHTRAHAIGGTIRIESQPGQGTTVLITAKIPENRDGFRNM